MTFDAPSVFLLIFVFAFVLTLLSFFLGVAHLSIGGHGMAHAHVGAGHGLHVGHVNVHVSHGGHIGQVHGGAAHGVHAGHGVHVAHDAPHAATDHGVDEGMSPFNMATMLAFLTWFGGAGYLFTGYLNVATVLAIILSTVIGIIGAGIVFIFMVRILLPGQTPYLSSSDYDLPGTIGRLTVGIREGGTGELVYSMHGTRRVASARTEDGHPLERGAEVVIVREEGSIAYVEPLETFMEDAAPEGARR